MKILEIDKIIKKELPDNFFNIIKNSYGEHKVLKEEYKKNLKKIDGIQTTVKTKYGIYKYLIIHNKPIYIFAGYENYIFYSRGGISSEWIKI